MARRVILGPGVLAATLTLFGACRCEEWLATKRGGSLKEPSAAAVEPVAPAPEPMQAQSQAPRPTVPPPVARSLPPPAPMPQPLVIPPPPTPPAPPPAPEPQPPQDDDTPAGESTQAPPVFVPQVIGRHQMKPVRLPSSALRGVFNRAPGPGGGVPVEGERK